MRINDITRLDEEPNQFKFKKVGIDTFTTSVEVKGYRIKVTVKKNGTKWIADCGGLDTASADTKRFAVIHLVTKLRKIL